MLKYWRILTILLGAAITISGCSTSKLAPIPSSTAPAIGSTPTKTPYQPVKASATPVRPTLSATPQALSFWIDETVPTVLRDEMSLAAGIQIAKSATEAGIRLEPVKAGIGTVRWVYALAAPFPTFTDGVSLDDLVRTWHGEKNDLLQGHPILMAASTKAAFTYLWGQPGEGVVQVADESQLINIAWNQRNTLALIPFEAIEPRWKVLQVDGLSPMDRSLDINTYPLVVNFGLTGDAEELNLVQERGVAANKPILPDTNRDIHKMTTVVMTGVTALVRATADRMEKKGVNYPAQDILSWLQNADFTHISNEISFDPTCAPPNASDPRLFFCSNPKYIELLDTIHANVIDMTGNHLNDFGNDNLLYTLDLYKQHGMKYFAAGENLDKARQPLLLEQNGNKIAFIGCNPVGPVHDWATADKPGAASCDMDWMEQEVRNLRTDGYLPIVTFQYYETYLPVPTPEQVRDFRRMAAAGAVIVSGSQAHRPQAMDFYFGGFIHYGLGNLFFDQMITPWTGTRNEYIDRHVFYNGRYIGTDLLTAVLEDYARPRPATQKERMAMLTEEFTASGWEK